MFTGIVEAIGKVLRIERHEDRADLTIEAGFGNHTLTSISSYTDRDILVLRDATQLTGSVTFDLGGSGAQVRLSSPLYDQTPCARSWRPRMS